MRRWLCAAVLFGLTACASAKGALCRVRTTGKPAEELPASSWFSLLLHGYSPQQNEVPRPPMDCMGTPIVLEAAADACAEALPAAEPLPLGKLSSSDVVTRPLGNGKWLAWTLTRKFHNGEALGPVAVVEVDGRDLFVRAMGTLRAYATNPQLRIEKVGGTTLLVAESETCDSGSPKLCQKMVRLVPLRRQRFIPEPFVDGNGQCAGPAWLHTYREKVTKLPGGALRKSELTAILSFKANELVIDEHVSVRDIEPGQPSAPATLHHNADGRRSIRVQNGKLVVTGPSLWARLVEPSK